MINPYSAGELKNILDDLIKARHITKAQALDRARQEYPDETEGFIELRAEFIREHDLVDSLIKTIPELIAQNNQRWIETLASTYRT